jgi:hypothetical protein
MQISKFSGVATRQAGGLLPWRPTWLAAATWLNPRNNGHLRMDLEVQGAAVRAARPASGDYPGRPEAQERMGYLGVIAVSGGSRGAARCPEWISAWKDRDNMRLDDFSRRGLQTRLYKSQHGLIRLLQELSPSLRVEAGAWICECKVVKT